MSSYATLVIIMASGLDVKLCRRVPKSSSRGLFLSCHFEAIWKLPLLKSDRESAKQLKKNATKATTATQHYKKSRSSMIWSS